MFIQDKQQIRTQKSKAEVILIPKRFKIFNSDT